MAAIKQTRGKSKPEPEANLPPWMRLLQAQLGFRLGHKAEAKRTLEALSDHIDELSLNERLKLLRLSERCDFVEGASDVLRHALGRDTLEIDFAVIALQFAQNTGSGPLVAGIEKVLLLRLADQDQMPFAVQAARIRQGPEQALALERSHKRKSRTRAEAQQLVLLLLDAGHPKLALRYLHLCRRKWPSAHIYRRLIVTALIAQGDVAEALEFVDGIGMQLSPSQDAKLRLPIYMQTGDFKAVLRLPHEYQSPLAPRQRLIAYLSAGDVHRASEAAEALQHQPDMTHRGGAHFRTTQLGASLEELKIYRAEAGPDDAPETLERFADRFFYPAKRVVEAWMAQSKPSVHKGNIPRSVVQFWDSPDPPEGIKAAVATWQNIERVSHDLYDRQTARHWLAQHLGKTYAQAFRLARNVYEESDFFRLCYLSVNGGLYVDADDKLLTSPDALFSDTSGLVLFREPGGALANNLICAEAEHPLIVRAREMCFAALTAREAENAWSKTGPGLLTRAAALHLIAHSGRADAFLTVRHFHELRTFAAPHLKMSHKSSPHYWNPNSTDVSLNIRDVLDEVIVHFGPNG